MRPLFFIVKPLLPSHEGLDLLASAVLLLDAKGCIAYANAAAENLLEISFKALSHQKLASLFLNGEHLQAIFDQAIANQFADKRQDLVLERVGRDALRVHVIVSALDRPDTPVLIEL